VWTLHDFKLLCPENSFFSNGTICEKCRGGRFYNCAVNRCKKGSLAASAVAGIEAYVHGAFGWCRRVDRFIAPSVFLKKKFEQFGWTEPRVEFVRNFLPSLGEAHPGGVGYGVFTGMLRPEKGVKTLLQALALAGNPRFYIAGDGPMRAELTAVAAELELTNTEFLGHLDRAALDRLVRDASFAVVPSEWYENCPYAMLEAMAGGKALIASNLGGMAELVQHDVTGLTFPPRDAAAVAAAIGRLGSDSALAVRLGSAARQFAERELTGVAHYGALRAVYDDVLGARTPAALRRVAVSSS
jgi:glycosyltransferase involved in cell wall biosynthesis